MTPRGPTSRARDARPTLRARATAAAARTLVRGVNLVPRERALRLGDAAGRLYGRLGGPRSDTVRRNLRIAFPDWREAERRRVAERSFGHLGRSLVEFCTHPQLDDAALRGLAEFVGFEHAEAARAASPGGGFICLTGHVGSWELLLAMMAAWGFPISVVHRARENPLLEGLVAELRGRRGVEPLPRGSAARAALRALRRGRVVAMTLDQNAPRSEGVFVPFFGRLACTRDGPIRLAMRTGMPVVPVFVRRLPDGLRHRVTVHPAEFLEPAAEGESEDARIRTHLERMTALVEDAIRAAPEQWTWTHRRWRTQPEGEPRPYPSRRRTLAQLGGVSGR